jgi:aspartyl-tRNA(Asn)/glutamyl-tRNA(Gln) amidotransferase subunit C
MCTMLTAAEVERIALLSRLALTDDEKARFARQLSAVLDYATQLANLDVEGIPPTATVIPIRSVMREGDGVFGSLPRAEALTNAPSTDGVSFIVQAALDAE